MADMHTTRHRPPKLHVELDIASVEQPKCLVSLNSTADLTRHRDLEFSCLIV